MGAVKAGEVERVLRSRPAGIDLLLVYGPDHGLVSERARAAARSAVDDPEDAFQLIRMDGDTLADDPARLVEEASTYGLFGNRRAIWVRHTARNIAPAVEGCLQVPLSDTLVVVEAGDLAKTSPLRQSCERSTRALALPCYADEARSLGAVIADTLRADGFAIDDEARDLLADHLGGDRLATRSELAKLALYAQGRTRVTLADVQAVVSDVSAVSFDEAVDAAFGGDAAALDASLGQHAAQGTSSSAMLSVAQRHALALLAARDRYEASRDLDAALSGWRGLRFQRKDAISRQIRRWRQGPISETIALLQAAVLAGRTSPPLADVAMMNALTSIAAMALAVQAAEAQSRLQIRSS
jgi:DNA polymerase-3 subunit delta